MGYLKKIVHLENQVKIFQNIHLKNNDKLKGYEKKSNQINSGKKDVDIQKQKVRDLTKEKKNWRMNRKLRIKCHRNFGENQENSRNKTIR